MIRRCSEACLPGRGWYLVCHRADGHPGAHYDMVEDADWTRGHMLDAASMARVERGEQLDPSVTVTFRLAKPASDEGWLW